MIKRLLVANRGEIACRIFRTCAARSIETVAVYSDADARAKHVREADHAVRLGPAPAAESYLRGDLIIDAAKAMQADAIHPGYGFLSENADFAEAVMAAGLIWVGPRPETIRSMGLKDEAKRIAEAAGVPVLPGYRGGVQDLATLKEAADEIGYPLLIKAVAGGGGRGIREVASASQLKRELTSAVREAETAFGDGRVMLEKLVTQPRHIEVQVFGDGQGKGVHLYERDCSFQRRRQKVIEEAPAPGLTDKVRNAMTAAAVKLACEVNYAGAGTVEFIVDGSGPIDLDRFWFLEMNTRLQVEHPVTEMITGIDLVAWQLDVASGQGLPLNQSDITMEGHAIEARICAEDPGADFRPGAGVIQAFGLPGGADGETVRWESGFDAGDRIPPNYDSMISKLVVGGADRASAIKHLLDLLAHTQLVGVASNVGFLRRCAGSHAFGEGTHHVNWIAEHIEALAVAPAAHAEIAASTVCDIQLEDDGNADPWSRKTGWRLNAPATREARAAIDATIYGPELAPVWNAEGEPLAFVTDLSERRFAVTMAGDNYLVEVPDFDAAAEALAGGDYVKAPMPGKLLSVAVQTGQTLSQGDPVAVLEAMKMEHTLVAPRDGTVKEVRHMPGDQLGEGAVILSLEAD